MIYINNRPTQVPENLANSILLDFLRDHLALTGTKFGCGQGLCGACTVHLNGEAVRSCQLSVADVVGQHLTTIEGLATHKEGRIELHPVQQAWIDEAVPQCGYCQAGQIMSAASLLAKNPAPSNTEIAEAMYGNLCRCGTYGRIRSAIHKAAKEQIND